MDDTDDQEEDTSLKKMADSFTTLPRTLHSSTKDVEEPLEDESKSSEDVRCTADSDTCHSVSPDIQYVWFLAWLYNNCYVGVAHSYPEDGERLRMRSVPFFYVPDGTYKRYRI